MKSPLTPAGIEPATFRIVAQHLNHCATVVPHPPHGWGALSFTIFPSLVYFFPSSFHDFISVLHHISVSSPVFLHFILSLSLSCCFLFEVSSSFVRIKLKLEDI